MPRGIKGSGKSRKPAGEPGQARRRGRTPKELLPEAVQSAELATAEAELVRKYPHVRIKPGSLRLGATEGWGNKRVVTIVCSECQVNERVVATSDLFHVSTCPQCSKAAKQAARKAK
jgi:hypothetical protein